MPRAKLILDFGIIARALVDILYHHTQGSTCRDTLKDTGQYLNFIRLAPLCRAQVNGVLNKAGVKRGQVRPQIVSRLHEIANAVLPPPLAAIVNLTDDPYPQALLDTAVPQMYRAPCPPVPPILSAQVATRCGSGAVDPI